MSINATASVHFRDFTVTQAIQAHVMNADINGCLDLIIRYVTKKEMG